MNYRELHSRLNGRITAGGGSGRVDNATYRTVLSYEVAYPQEGSNHWSSTEYNRNNARNVNFNNGNANNNNKYNSNVVRPVTAFHDVVPSSFLLSVWIAYHDCLHGKMTSTQAIEYMQIAETDIPRLAYELWTGIYNPGTSTCFLVRYPKWREVFAANFRDRIVHHWICLRLEPLFEHRFRMQGDVSFNCRKGYGTDKAVGHLAEAMRRISDNYHKLAWVFRGDIVGFFMSIDKDLLWYLLERFIKRWRKRYERGYEVGVEQDGMYWDILLRTTKVVVMHHPELNCVLNSEPYLWSKHMEANKSLFTSLTGEPIGNLTTQLFANFLMSFFISYVKFVFRRKNFDIAQFVDDFSIVCDDLEFLVSKIEVLSNFLDKKLRLKLHKNKRYLQPVSHGILFVGTFIKPGRNYLSNRTLGRMIERCKGYGRMVNEESVDVTKLQRMEEVLNSYLGFCRNRKTYNFRKSCIASLGDNFWKYFYVKGRYESIRLKRQYRLLN